MNAHHKTIEIFGVARVIKVSIVIVSSLCEVLSSAHDAMRTLCPPEVFPVALTVFALCIGNCSDHCGLKRVSGEARFCACVPRYFGVK
jgi:hypothetical protein